jgi:cytochrome c oxidase subunit 2
LPPPEGVSAASPSLRLLLAAVTLPSALALGAPGGFAATRRFEIAASRFHYEPATIEVDEGDRVVLSLHSADTEHGLEIKAYKLKVTIPKNGDVVVLDFVATKAGIFTFKCSEYCGSGHERMKGRLIVHAAAETAERNKP